MPYNVRRVALDILMRLGADEGEGYSAILLDAAIKKHNIDGADKIFAICKLKKWPICKLSAVGSIPI